MGEEQTVVRFFEEAEIGDEIYSKVIAVASGERTKSELLRHQEFILTYKTFEPIGPACLPARSA